MNWGTSPHNAAAIAQEEHGTSGLRKAKIKRPVYFVGKQCHFLASGVANSLLDAIKAEGFTIGDENTVRQCAAKGLLDSFTIRPA